MSEKKEKVYPRGIITFSPKKGCPDFVKGSIIIDVKEFNDFVLENKHLLKDYNGKKQLQLQLLEGNKGLYTVVDTFQKQDDNPFS